MELWQTRFNAEVYDLLVRVSRIYRALNHRIASLSELRSARRVLDLGYGTGATASACLASMASDARLVGVDASAPMVDLARQNVLDPRASFHVSGVSDLDRNLLGSFDRVVCNAALQYFPSLHTTIGAVARILEPGGGLFVFNIPNADVVGEVIEPHPFQVTLARVIESVAGEPYRDTRPLLDPIRLYWTLDQVGFTTAERRIFSLSCSQGEVMELMGVPALVEPLAPQLSPAEREDAVRRAGEHSDPTEVVSIPWTFVKARRSEALGS